LTLFKLEKYFPLVLFVQNQTLGKFFQFGWMRAFKMGTKKDELSFFCDYFKGISINFKFSKCNFLLDAQATLICLLIELSVKSSKESTKLVSLLKTGNKVVEVG
jgi:hypothetical protein